MATINLSRFAFLNPRIAAILIWVGLIYSWTMNVLSPWLGMSGLTPMRIQILSSLLPSLIFLYAIMVLWKILQEHFQFFKADWGFLVYLVASIFYTAQGFIAPFRLNLSSWLGNVLVSVFPSVVLIVLMILILGMPQDLFKRKVHLASTIIGLRLLSIGQIVLMNLRSDISLDGIGMSYVFMGIGILFFILNLLNTIFLYQIFRSAHKNSLVPVPHPSEMIIEEIGEEEL